VTRFFNDFRTSVEPYLSAKIFGVTFVTSCGGTHFTKSAGIRPEKAELMRLHQSGIIFPARRRQIKSVLRCKLY
jgi:hypothetical protein